MPRIHGSRRASAAWLAPKSSAAAVAAAVKRRVFHAASRRVLRPQHLPRFPRARGLRGHRRQRQHAEKRQHGQREKQHGAVCGAVGGGQRLRRNLPSRCRSAAEISIGRTRQRGDAQYQPHQNASLSDVKFHGHQPVDFHFRRGVIRAAEQQGEAETRKAVEENQARTARQPRQQHGTFYPPKAPPRVRAQRARRRQPRRRHGA